MNVEPGIELDSKKQKSFVLTPRSVKRESLPKQDTDLVLCLFLESSQGQLEKFGAQVVEAKCVTDGLSAHSSMPEIKIEREVRLVKDIMLNMMDMLCITNRIATNPRSTDLFLDISDENMNSFIADMLDEFI